MSRVRTRTYVTIEEQRPYVHTHRAPPRTELHLTCLTAGSPVRWISAASAHPYLRASYNSFLPSSLRCPIGVPGRFLLMRGGNPHSFVISGTAVTRSGCWSPPSVLPGAHPQDLSSPTGGGGVPKPPPLLGSRLHVCSGLRVWRPAHLVFQNSATVRRAERGSSPCDPFHFAVYFSSC